MSKIILLNGPPRVGKDTIAERIVAEHPAKAIRIGFADHLKAATHAAYGLYSDRDAYEPWKDKSLDNFFGLTPRQAYIAHSEKYMKVLHGPRVFGTLFVRSVPKNAHVVIVPDSGFRDEALEVIDYFGADNVRLVRLYRDGCTFKGDSRSYIDLTDAGVKCYDVENSSTEDHAADQVLRLTGFLPGLS